MNIAGKIANGILNSKPAVYLTKPNAASAAATIALLSGVTKDAVNCYYYVTQSLGNDRIPEDKRKFVAGLDLSNGILNVITQTALGYFMMPKLVNKMFGFVDKKYFSKDAIGKMYENLKTTIPFDDFSKIMNRNKNLAKTGLSVVATLVGTQIIAKRVIVPLIATPMASYFKEKFEKMDKSKTPQENNNITNNQSTGQKLNIKENQTDNAQTNTAATNKENVPECFKNFMK